MDFGSCGGGSADYLTEYKSISNKLKKRFLRRPNVSEASDQFSKLAKKLSTNDEPEYAAQCHVAVARCEQSNGNVEGEVEARVAAARSFFEAEINVRRIGCVSFQQHLLEAIDNYHNAVQILEGSVGGGNAVRASGLCLELGEKLQSLGKHTQAVRWYEKAAELRSEFVGPDYIRAKEKVASCFLHGDDFRSALATLTEIANLTQQMACDDADTDVLSRCEIFRVLLVLLIEPTPRTMSSNLTQVVEKYALESCSSSSSSEKSLFPEPLFLLMRSLVMAVEIRDHEALVQLEDCLIPFIEDEPQQRELLRRLVEQTQRRKQ